MVEEFIEENLKLSKNGFETGIDIYTRYKKYCKVKNVDAILTKHKLSIELKKRGIGIQFQKTLKGKNLYGRQGVRLKPCPY